MNPYAKVDYSGRTVDLLLLKAVLSAPVLGQRVDIDADGTPMIVAGIEKLVQRYAVEFLTALGSAKFRPDHGTNLVPSVAKGMVYNMATLESTAAEANMMAVRQIKAADEGEDTPDDEKLDSAEIYDLKFSRGEARIGVSVRITTAAGSSYVYIIPVDVGVH